MEKSDLDDVKYVAELPKYLVPTLALVESLYGLRESQLPRFKSFDTLKPHINIDTSSLLSAIGEARVVKSDYEIAMIRKASDKLASSPAMSISPNAESMQLEVQPALIKLGPQSSLES